MSFDLFLLFEFDSQLWDEWFRYSCRIEFVIWLACLSSIDVGMRMGLGSGRGIVLMIRKGLLLKVLILWI